MGSGIDISCLNLLAEVAVDSETMSSSGISWDVSAIEILMELKIMKKKGLLADLDKALFIPKKKRSMINLSKRTQFLTLMPINSKRSNFPVRIQKKKKKTTKRIDLLGFIVPKKKRSSLGSHQNRTGNIKRKRQDDDQVQSVKRQNITTSADQLGCSLISSVQLELKSIPLWSFQRKSEIRFSLIKLHQSPGTTMVL